jgi:hypothetical protein
LNHATGQKKIRIFTKTPIIHIKIFSAYLYNLFRNAGTLRWKRWLCKVDIMALDADGSGWDGEGMEVLDVMELLRDAISEVKLGLERFSRMD